MTEYGHGSILLAVVCIRGAYDSYGRVLGPRPDGTSLLGGTVARLLQGWRGVARRVPTAEPRPCKK